MIVARIRAWLAHRRTQRLIDENRRLLAERDRLMAELAALAALSPDRPTPP